MKPTRIELYDKIFAFPQRGYIKSGNAATANMFSYYSVFEKIGLFDDNLLSGGDFVWGMRAQHKNFPIGYSPDVIVKHPARASLKELSTKATRVGKGQADFQNGKNSKLNILWETLHIIKPRLYEVQRIFKKGKGLDLREKLFLIFLRHYLIWVAGFSRMKQRDNSQKLKF